MKAQNALSYKIVLFAAAAAMMVICGVSPAFTLLCALVAACAVCTLCADGSVFLSGGALVLGGCIALVMGADPFAVLMGLAYAAGGGFTLGLCIRHKWPFKRMLILTLCVVTACAGVVSLLEIYVQYGAITADTILKPYEDYFTVIYQELEAMGMAPKVTLARFLQLARDMISSSLFPYLVLSSTLFSFVTFWLSRFLIAKAKGTARPYPDYFTSFQVSRVGAVVYAGCFLISMFSTESKLFATTLASFIMILSPAFVFGGMAVLNFFMDRGSFSLLKKGICFVLIFLTAVVISPLFNLVYGLIAFGLVDSFANYRKL